ncbi:hypothetical protein CKO09_01695 [Chromatium weissei]|nr:hypothetical protein [Chromatium weissei]
MRQKTELFVFRFALTVIQIPRPSETMLAAFSNKRISGNVIKLTAIYTTTDGQTHLLADVWLAGVSDIAV